MKPITINDCMKKITSLEKQVEEIKSKLLESQEFKTSEPKQGRWKPEVREWYFYIYNGTCVAGVRRDADDEFFLSQYPTGNCYRTREEAENVVALKKHIYSAEMPENKWRQWYYACDDSGCELKFYKKFTTFETPKEIAMYHAGLIVNKNATPEFLAERVSLLSKVYGK